ncbi:MAG: hypothetical protein M1814_003724 [Vezdaea aestivalis]|nr:MAG: hypothetical protein M1814_003724 [Vezdaea aestivalis]
MSDSSYYTNQYNDTNGLLPNGNYSQASSNSTSSPKEPLYTGTQNYSGFAYSEFTPENQPQPSIPFTFEAPTRSRRRRRQPSFPTREAQQEDFDFPQPRSYQLNPPGLSDGSPAMSQTEKGQLISALRNNQIKTLVELRRVEKSFINSGDYDLRDAVAASWGYYVNSNNLLNELRTLTRSYPFASECLDEAKWKCTEDPNSGRSWNYCWLVLVKVQNE